MTTLLFDTAHPDGPRIGVHRLNTPPLWSVLPGQWHSTDQLMPKFLKLLSKHHLALSDIQRILVVPGPGSFTAVRAGVVWANALAFALSLPVGEISRSATPESYDTIKMTTVVRPLYGAEPHISKKKTAE